MTSKLTLKTMYKRRRNSRKKKCINDVEINVKENE